jgi:hypothetical protein
LDGPFTGDADQLESMKWEARPNVQGNKPNEIVAVLTRIFKVFVKIGNVTEEQKKWPLLGLMDLDEDASWCESIGESRIRRLRNIPWTTAMVGIEHDSHLVDYSHKGEMTASRFPDGYDEED